MSIIWGLFFTPEDFVQGNSYRIIYLHVPASFLSQTLYLAMAISSITYLIWRVKLAAYLIIAIAPIGAMTTFIALISGSIWGIPTWGTWWQWDARITSTLILFIMYLGLISLHGSFSNYEKADKLLSWLVIVGFVLLIIPGIIVGLALSMTFIVMADRPELSFSECLNESWNLTSGYRFKLLGLNLRFIPWYLLCSSTVN